MNRFFKSALAALPLLMLASCAEDDLAVDDGIVKKTETRYLRVTLSSADAAPGSRAEGVPTTPIDPQVPDVEGDGLYQVGTVDENKIKTLEFYFYDVNKQPHSYRSMSLDLSKDDSDGSQDIDPDPITGNTKPNISGFYHCNVPVELVQGESMPRYVICIINSVEGSSYVNATMEDAQKKTLSDIYGSLKTGDKKYFGMSNSVYYGMDEVTSKDDQLIMATPFPAEALKTETELDGMNSAQLEEIAVNIYVERYAVKVNLDLGTSEADKTPIEDYTTGTENVSLRFEPKAWAVNGTEKKFFFLKAYRTKGASTITPNDGDAQGSYGLDYEIYETMNKILFNGWNNESHHRSFWARTPGYYTNNYPVVTDDMENADGIYDRDKYDINYYTYNECLKNNPFSGKYNYTNYVMETTMTQDRLTGVGMGDQYLPTAALPSVIMVGQYKVVGAEGAEPIDLYAYGKEDVTIGDKKESRYKFYTGDTEISAGTNCDLTSIKKKMLDDQTIILKKVGDGDNATYPNYTSADIGETLYNKFVIEHPSKEVRMATTTTTVGEASGGGLKVAADVVALQISSYSSDDNLWFYNPVSNKYEQINASNVNIANRLLFQNLGGARLYKKGMAFFFAPIYHWGWYRTEEDKRPEVEDGPEVPTDNPNRGKTMAEWDWSKMRTGDFGLVRNHVYTMKIGTISGLGNAIKDPDDPIVPPADKVSYEVHFHVNIQKWAVLPTQTWNW